MAYEHRKKNPSSDSIMKVTNFQDDSQLSYENYQHIDSDRSLSSWEKGELRDYCAANGLECPSPANFQDFFRIVGRGPEYWSDKTKSWIVPQIGGIV